MRIHLLLVIFAVCSERYPALAESWPPPDVTGLVEFAPKPKPVLGVHGTSIFLLRVHIPSGHVSQVIVGRSTGNQRADSTTVKTLSTWRFKPGAAPYRKITSVKMSPAQGADETLVKVPVIFAR